MIALCALVKLLASVGEQVHFQDSCLTKRFTALCTVVLLLFIVNEHMSLQISLCTDEFAAMFTVVHLFFFMVKFNMVEKTVLDHIHICTFLSDLMILTEE